MIPLAQDTMPDNTGYVLAAYLVFLALVLLYLVITVVRLGRLEQELVALDDLAREQDVAPAAEARAAKELV